MELKSTAEWLEHGDFAGITIVDPDGWDRTNLEASYAEPISRKEFEKRLSLSSSMHLPGPR